MKRAELEQKIFKELDEFLMSDDRDSIFDMVENLKRCEEWE